MSREVRLQRGRVHRDEHVGRVARRRRCRGRRCAPGTTTRRRSCRPARGSRPGSSGSVARSLPNAADSSVKRSPTSCIPSPESPANRITTRSSVSARGSGSPLRSPLTPAFSVCQLPGCAAPSARAHRAGTPSSQSAARAVHCTVAARANPVLGGHASGVDAAHSSSASSSSSTRRRGRATRRRSRGRRDDLGLDLDPRRRRARRPGRTAAGPGRRRRSRRPVSSASTQAGGSSTATGIDSARPSSRVVTCSCASTLLRRQRPAPRAGSSTLPRTTARFNSGDSCGSICDLPDHGAVRRCRLDVARGSREGSRAETRTREGVTATSEARRGARRRRRTRRRAGGRATNSSRARGRSPARS